MRISQRILYRGTVQGVGFRMTTTRCASQFDVTGYVRNLPDGQVEVVVTGEADEIGRFLGLVASRMASYIQGQTAEDVPLQEFDGFGIRT
jgi:acylphosphatase